MTDYDAMRDALRGLATDRPRRVRAVPAERIAPDSETARQLERLQQQLRALAELGRDQKERHNGSE